MTAAGGVNIENRGFTACGSAEKQQALSGSLTVLRNQRDHGLNSDLECVSPSPTNHNNDKAFELD